MSLPQLVVPAVSVAAIGVTLRCGSDALLKLVAGITAIAAKDDAQTRAQRALAVLRALRRDRQPPPPDDG